MSFDACAEILSSIDSISFRFRPLTDEPIQKAVRLANFFEKLSETERHQVCSLIKQGLNMKLLSLSGFMAEAAINKNDASLIKPAIVLHMIENFQKDYRENIRYLVLVAFAAKKLGIDFHSFVSTLLPLASEPARKGILDFSARGDDLNQLSSFGMRENIDDGTFRFVPM